MEEVRVVTLKDLQKFGANLSLLLRYAKRDDLIQFLGFNEFKAMERYIKEHDPQGKFSLTKLKKQLKDDPDLFGNRLEGFISHVYRNNYIPAIEKQNSREGIEKRALRKERSKLMRMPRRKYLGCIATRVNPDDYGYCLTEYDNPNEQYEKYKMVPNNALREQVYSKALARGDAAASRALQLPEKAKISYLPNGLQTYYRAHPARYDAYLYELGTQKKFLEAVRTSIAKGLTVEDRERLRGRVLASIGVEEEEEEY